MELGKGAADRKRKRIIQVVFILFMALLLFFTLFSNTLQSLTMPKVSTEKPKFGSLALTIEGSGILAPVAEAKLFSTTDWKVQQIFVKEGDRVKKGQKLVTYDSQPARQELELEITNLERQKIEQQNLQDQYILSSIEEDEIKMRNAKREIEKGKLDIAAQERKIHDMQERLNRDQVLMAPFDGIVTKLNAVEGLASAGEADVIVANSSQGYRFEVQVDARKLSALGISAGEQIDVEVDLDQEQQASTLEGVIEEITRAEPLMESMSGEEEGKSVALPQKLLRIKLVDAKLKGGEQARINIRKNSLQEGLLVSSEAVHQDREGMYVFIVEEQRGPLGNDFIARKVNVQSSETSGNMTMIQSDSIFEEDRIILKSGEPLQDGNHVRLE